MIPESAFSVIDELCELAGAADIFELLDLDVSVSEESMMVAIRAYRKRMQAMQANPKWKHVSRLVGRQYRVIEAGLSDLSGYRAHRSRIERERSHLPLRMAIRGMMADGGWNSQRERFAQDLALNLGIHPDVYDEVAGACADEAGIQRLRATHGGAAQRTGWWDEDFSKVILSEIPPDASSLVDAYCRMAWSAHALLPHRPDLHYQGFDRNKARVALAAEALSHFDERARLAIGTLEGLPASSASVDVVLLMRALQNSRSPMRDIQECTRLLKPSGRLIMAETDGMAEVFYFNGQEIGLTTALRRLVERAGIHATHEGSLPGSVGGQSIGPTLVTAVEALGLQVVRTHVHASSNLWVQSAGDFIARFKGYAMSIAKNHGVRSADPAWKAVSDAVRTFEARVNPAEQRLGGNVLPFFVVSVAAKG